MHHFSVLCVAARMQVHTLFPLHSDFHFIPGSTNAEPHFLYSSPQKGTQLHQNPFQAVVLEHSHEWVCDMGGVWIHSHLPFAVVIFLQPLSNYDQPSIHSALAQSAARCSCLFIPVQLHRTCLSSLTVQVLKATIEADEDGTLTSPIISHGAVLITCFCRKHSVEVQLNISRRCSVPTLYGAHEWGKQKLQGKLSFEPLCVSAFCTYIKQKRCDQVLFVELTIVLAQFTAAALWLKEEKIRKKTEERGSRLLQRLSLQSVNVGCIMLSFSVGSIVSASAAEHHLCSTRVFDWNAYYNEDRKCLNMYVIYVINMCKVSWLSTLICTVPHETGNILKVSKINYEFPAARFNPLATHDLAIKPNFNRHGLYLFYIWVGSHRFTTALSSRKQIRAFGSIWSMS